MIGQANAAVSKRSVGGTMMRTSLAVLTLSVLTAACYSDRTSAPDDVIANEPEVALKPPPKYLCYMSFKHNLGDLYTHSYVILQFPIEHVARADGKIALLRLSAQRDGDVRRTLNCHVPATAESFTEALSTFAGEPLTNVQVGTRQMLAAVKAVHECVGAVDKCAEPAHNISCLPGFDAICDEPLPSAWRRLQIVEVEKSERRCDQCTPAPPEELSEAIDLRFRVPGGDIGTLDDDVDLDTLQQVPGNRWNCKGRTDYAHRSGTPGYEHRVNVHSKTYNCNTPVNVWVKAWLDKWEGNAWVQKQVGNPMLHFSTEVLGIANDDCTPGQWRGRGQHEANLGGVIAVGATTGVPNFVTCGFETPIYEPPEETNCNYYMTWSGETCEPGPPPPESEWDWLCWWLELEPVCWDVYVDDVFQETICC